MKDVARKKGTIIKVQNTFFACQYFNYKLNDLISQWKHWIGVTNWCHEDFSCHTTTTNQTMVTKNKFAWLQCF